MFNVGPTELVVILVLALIIFGPGKLPEVGKAIGKSIKEFKNAAKQVTEDEGETRPKQSTAAGGEGVNRPS